MDWGCKIWSDGAYWLSFTGEEHYLEPMGIPKTTPIQLESGEGIRAQEWVPLLRTRLEKTLAEQIENLKGRNPQKQLSQADVTSLLERIQKIVTELMPGIHCFFSTDYVLDQEEAMTYIASYASPHYLRSFSLMVDATDSAGYKISGNEI